ncbi:MAG: response regulator [Bacillota bacterium]
MYTVLIADDEQIERSFLRSVINAQQNHYRVIAEAVNGQKALALAKSMQPDVAILDINMPVINGLEAARQIKRLFPGMVIILNSAYAEFDFAQQAISCGVNAYLIKPANAELILSTLEGCLRSRALRPSSGVTLGFSPGESYPYELVEKLLASIANRDARMMAACSEAYLKFFRERQTHHEHYQLFIINTLFSILHELQKAGIPGELTQLLCDHVYLSRISRAESWQEVLLHLEEFIARLQLLLIGCEIGVRTSISQVVQYIDQNYEKNIALNDLAEMVHLSPAYLSRRFHQEQGMSIRNYIAFKRMERAGNLLQTSDLSIREIAETCGFSNASYFHRMCREHTGLSPAQVRQQFREGDA